MATTALPPLAQPAPALPGAAVSIALPSPGEAPLPAAPGRRIHVYVRNAGALPGAALLLLCPGPGEPETDAAGAPTGRMRAGAWYVAAQASIPALGASDGWLWALDRRAIGARGTLRLRVTPAPGAAAVPAAAIVHVRGD